MRIRRRLGRRWDSRLCSLVRNTTTPGVHSRMLKALKGGPRDYPYRFFRPVERPCTWRMNGRTEMAVPD